MAWFRRGTADSLDPQYLLEQAHGGATRKPAGAPGFRMPVEDVFRIKGKGTVVTGRIVSGEVQSDTTVMLTRADGTARDVEIAGVEMYGKRADVAVEGDNVGVVLRGLDDTAVGRGDLLSS